MRQRIDTLTEREREQLRRDALELRRSGASWKSMGTKFNMRPDTIRCLIDPVYHAHVNDAHIRKRQRERQDGLSYILRPTSAQEHADAAARLAEVPPDTRTPSQILMGDPIPCRSALATSGKSISPASHGVGSVIPKPGIASRRHPFRSGSGYGMVRV